MTRHYHTPKRVFSLILALCLGVFCAAVPTSAVAANESDYEIIPKVTVAIPNTNDLKITFTNVASRYSDDGFQYADPTGGDIGASGDPGGFWRGVTFYLADDATICFNKQVEILHRVFESGRSKDVMKTYKAGEVFKYSDISGENYLQLCDGENRNLLDRSTGSMKDLSFYNVIFSNAKGLSTNWIYKGTRSLSEITTKDETSQITVVATPTNAKVLLNGVDVPFDAYNINGNNYFKLRDLAYAVENLFNVTYEDGNIFLHRGSPYTVVGGEMSVGDGKSKNAILSTDKIYDITGKQLDITAYKIGGSNYVKLRDIGDVVGFEVDWRDNAVIIETGSNSLSRLDFESIFIDGLDYQSRLYYRLSYWSAIASAEVYHSSNIDPNEGLGLNLFTDVETFEYSDGRSNMKVDCGIRRIDDGHFKGNVLAISFRGTDNPENWVSNLVFSPMPFNNNRDLSVHTGFYSTFYTSFVKNYTKTGSISNQIKDKYGIDVFTDKNTVYWISGHSLGGAYAEILAIYLADCGVPAENIICVGLASPPIGSDTLFNYARDTLRITNRIYKFMEINDPVPTYGVNAVTMSANPEEFNSGYSTEKTFDCHFLENTYIPYLHEKAFGE